VLDIPRSSRKVSIEETDFDLHGLINGTSGVLAPQAEIRGLQLRTLVMPEAPTRCAAIHRAAPGRGRGLAGYCGARARSWGSICVSSRRKHQVVGMPKASALRRGAQPPPRRPLRAGARPIVGEVLLERLQLRVADPRSMIRISLSRPKLREQSRHLLLEGELKPERAALPQALLSGRSARPSSATSC